MNTPLQRLLRTQEVSAYLSISVSTVRRMSERGELPGRVVIRPGVVRWDRAVLDKYLDECSGCDAYLDPDLVVLHERKNRKAATG